MTIKGETIRDLYARWEALPLKDQLKALRARREAATMLLRVKLIEGDRIRAIKAVCNARETSYRFSHWEGGWIMSYSGCSISPDFVYSVNGEVIRLQLDQLEPQP
jgi:hypothetical protein